MSARSTEPVTPREHELIEQLKKARDPAFANVTIPSAQTVTADPYAMTVDNLRRRSNAVYLACEEPVAKDISESLRWAADEIDRLTSRLAAADARGKRLEEALRLSRRVVAEQEQEWGRKSYRYIEGTKNPYTGTLKLIDTALSQTEEVEPKASASVVAAFNPGGCHG